MFNERGIKEAFEKVKKDIFTLGNDLSSLKLELTDIKNMLNALDKTLTEVKIASITPTHIPTHPTHNPTDSVYPSDTPTVPVEVGGLKTKILGTSTGNRGVPTDRQTNQQTDNPTDFSQYRPSASLLEPPKTISDSLTMATEVLESLDNIKKEIRLKFKQMTNQEMLVFTTIYQLEYQFPEGIEYKEIALKLKLSESSIRDYVQKLISKGIPILKEKLNNKKILIKISPDLKKVASLETILKLRGL